MPTSILPLVGGLREIPLSSLLYFLKSTQKTGILTVSREKVSKSVYFQDGKILFATSTYLNDALRIFLLREGKINFTQLIRCDTALRSSEQKEETLLLGQGSIKPKELFDLLRLQIREIILSLFYWTDARYTFSMKPIPQEMSIGLSMNPDEIIKEGLYRVTDIACLMQSLPPLNAILLKNQHRLTEDLVCSEEEKTIFSLINDERTVQDILMQSSLLPLTSIQILNLLVATGITSAHLVSVGQRLGEPASAVGTQGPLKKSEGQEKPKEESGDESTEVVPHEESTEEHIRTILTAYKKLRSQNYYEILGVSNSASPEEIKHAYFRMAKRYHPDRHTGEAFSIIIKKIEEIFLAVKMSYETLSDNTLRTQYDRALLKPSAAPVSEKRTLSARDYLHRAEAALLENNMKNAFYFFEEAIRLMQEPHEKSAICLRYGQVLSGIPGQLHAAEEMLQNAARLNSADVRPYLQLGLIFQKAGVSHKATAAFQEVLKREPTNKTALEGINSLKNKKIR